MSFYFLLASLFAKLLLLALPAWALGTWFNPHAGWAVMVLGLIVMLLRQWRAFMPLQAWSQAPSVDLHLQTVEPWDSVLARLYRHEKKQSRRLQQKDHEIATLQAAGQALTDGVVLLDEQEQILFCNTTAERQLGLKNQQDRGQAIVNLVRQPEFVSYLQQGDFQQPLALHSERDRALYLLIHVLPYTRHKRLLQIKDVSQDQAVARMQRDFIANVSHELCTPLTVLSGYVETLHDFGEELSGDERVRAAALMSTQCSRMRSIVDDLLQLSGIESAPEPPLQAIAMDHLLSHLCTDARQLAAVAEKNLRIVLHLATTVNDDGCAQDDDGLNADSGTVAVPVLLGAEQEITGAVMNLLSNAVRYTPDGGVITVLWRDAADHHSAGDGAAGECGAVLSVSDTGVGIADEHLPRLGERFYRVDRSRSRAEGGTGLGLALVKHIAKRHQAELHITSRLGAGSTFSLHFPPERVQRGTTAV